MSERPESMFCGDCVYYAETDTPHEGVCKRYPAYVPKVVFDHCGEFREEWPEEDATRLLEKWAEGIVRRDA